MGSVCCCFNVSDVGGHAASNNQNHNFCKCFSCCFQKLINKYSGKRSLHRLKRCDASVCRVAALKQSDEAGCWKWSLLDKKFRLKRECGIMFGQAQETVGSSANQGPSSSSTALVSINSLCNTISSQDRGLPNSATPRQLQIQGDVAFRRQDKGTSHSRVEPEPDIDADNERTQKLIKADKLRKSGCANQGPSSSTAVVSVNSPCNTMSSQDRGLPNSGAPRPLQMQEDVAFRRQDKGTSRSRVEPEPDVDVDVEITQKLPKAALLESDCANQGPSSSTAVVSVKNSCNTIRSQDRDLPNSAAPRQPQPQDKRTSHARVEPVPDISADVEITQKLLKTDKLLKPDSDGGAKECCPESPEKDYSSMMVPGLQYEVSSSEDEDVCPTCLEEYTPENPKILTKCSHHYHLSCIYEWQERSEKCPVCGKLMEFEETN